MVSSLVETSRFICPVHTENSIYILKITRLHTENTMWSIAKTLL